MVNHPNRTNPGLTFPEARSIIGVLSDVDLAHFETYSSAERARYDAANSKLESLPRGAVMVPFTQAEIAVLWGAITNGAEGVLQPSSGYSSAQKRAFREAANRLNSAGKLTAPYL